MGIKAVRAYLKSLEVVPPVPSEKNMAAQKNPLQINAVPSVPSVPSKNTNSRDVFQPQSPSGVLKQASPELAPPAARWPAPSRSNDLVDLAPACSTLASAGLWCLSWWNWRRLQHAGQRRAVVLELVALAPACSTLASAAPLERTGGAGAACSTLASAAPWCLSWWSWRRLQHAGRASGFRVATAQQADILFSVRAGGWLECLECPKSSKRGVATSKRGNKWGNKTEFWFSVSLQINGLHDEYGSDKPQLVQRPLGTYS